MLYLLYAFVHYPYPETIGNNAKLGFPLTPRYFKTVKGNVGIKNVIRFITEKNLRDRGNIIYKIIGISL